MKEKISDITPSSEKNIIKRFIKKGLVTISFIKDGITKTLVKTLKISLAGLALYCLATGVLFAIAPQEHLYAAFNKKDVQVDIEVDRKIAEKTASYSAQLKEKSKYPEARLFIDEN